MRLTVALAIGLGTVAFQGAALAVTISVDLERLQDAAGASMPVSGLVVLTAAVSGTFYGPTATSFAGGDELVLKEWDLSGFETPGAISDFVSNLTLSGAWNTGDLLRVYWYPSLTLNSTAPGAGTAFGSYSDPVGIDGSDPWVTPGNGSEVALKFATNDASLLLAPGSNPSSAGRASQVVVPEPGTLGLMASALFISAAVSRRRRVG